MSSRFYTSVVKLKSKIHERYIEDGVRKTHVEEFEPELYVLSANPETAVAKSLAGQALDRIPFKNSYDMEAYVEQMKGTKNYKLFGSESTLVQYMAKVYNERHIKFDFNLIRGAFVDIEVESGYRDHAGVIHRGPFPKPTEADYEITALTLYASHLKTFFVYGLEWFKGEYIGTFDLEKLHPSVKKTIESGVRVVYQGYKTEEQLLKDFVHNCYTQEYDYITGWNSDTFDIPYFANRIEKVIGRKELEKISPLGAVRKRSFQSKFGEEVTYNLYGIENLDMMEIIKKHGFIQLDNAKLNTAAKHFLGDEKLEYEGSLTEFYYNDYQNYIAYNIMDVNIVRRIDQKKHYIQFCYILAYLYHCNVSDVMATVTPWSHLMYSAAARENQFTELRFRSAAFDYVGGYVRDVTPGRYKWVVSVDAQALYPHMAQQFNMGIETIIPEALTVRIIEAMANEILAIPEDQRTDIDKMYLKKLQNREHIYDVFWLHPYRFKTLKRLNICMAPNLSFYKLDFESLLRKQFKDLYSTRKVIKKEMLRMESELQKVIDSLPKDEIAKLKEEIANLDLNQHGHKIAANAGYGGIANEHFIDHFDIRIAEAITSGGQVSTRFIMHRMNEWLNETFKITGDQVFYGDTDSIYSTFEKVVISAGMIDKPDTEIVDWLDELVDKTLQPLFNKWAEELADYYNCDMNGLFFKREAIATSAIFTGKKNYAMLVLDNEGVRYAHPKLKVAGLASRKANYPMFCRKWLEEAYTLTLNEDKEGIFDFVEKCKVEFMARSVNEIGSATNIENMEDFDLGEGRYKSGSPYHVVGALNHNFLVKEFGIPIKPIISGNKYFVLPLKDGAPFRMKWITFDEKLPVEMKLEQYINKEKAYEKSYLQPLSIFLGAVGWDSARPTTHSLLDTLFG